MSPACTANLRHGFIRYWKACGFDKAVVEGKGEAGFTLRCQAGRAKRGIQGGEVLDMFLADGENTARGGNMIGVITISREFGSGGSEVARILAERLEWKLIDDPLVAEIAKRANVSADLARRYDECIDPWFHRMCKALWRGGYEGVVSRGELNAFDADAMADLWTRVIRESAALAHCVIVGRGAQCLLQDRPGAFHVSVFAEMDERVRNLRGPLRRHVPPGADPKAMAEESDQRRSSYVRRYFGIDWKDYRLYHLVINSAVGFEAAATAILAAAGLSARQPALPSL